MKPAQPLPLKEHETVQVTVVTEPTPIIKAYGIMGWKGDAETCDYFAMSPDLDPLNAKIFDEPPCAIRFNNMNEIIFLIEDAAEGGYTARALGVSIFTDADNLDQLRANIREAVECHFDAGQGPKVIRLHYVREEVLLA